MDIDRLLHMNAGEDEKSYAKNSSFQKHVISVMNPIVASALADCFQKSVPESIGIADLGCSSGPNSLMVVSRIINGVRALCCEKGIKEFPEMRVAVNDLITNDFNNIFTSLPEFYEKLGNPKNCFISAVAGSFYGRLFPNNSLHFVHSSFGVHWLSQVPKGLIGKGKEDLNKGKICVSDTSPECVFNAYRAQFESDFFDFMRSRSAEIVPGGRMVLYFIGRKTPRPSVEYDNKLELLSHALMSLASEGLIDEKKLDSFNHPHYTPSVDEVKKVIAEEGSFVPNVVEVAEVKWEQELENSSRGSIISRIMRAANEPMLQSYFGCGTEVMDKVFARLCKLIDESEPMPQYIMIVYVTRSSRRKQSESSGLVDEL